MRLRSALAAAARELERRPVAVLAALIGVQWVVTLAFALTVRHNGWLYYQGGDQTVLWTSAWSLSEGHVPRTDTGYGWPYLLAPLALAFGPSFLAGLPALVLLQVLVLLPAGLLAVYGIAARLGGRLLGYWAAALWIAVPFAAIPLFVDRYHQKYVELFLPQALGLSGLADFPSTVALAGAAFLVVRALDGHDLRSGALAGLLAGFAIGIKPSTGIFVLAAAPALAIARRWRVAGAFAAGIVLPLLALAAWKQRGLGALPLLETAPDARFAAGGGAIPVADGRLDRLLDRYLPLDWDHLEQQYLGLREFFWSPRLLQWLPIAGVIAVARRSVAASALLGLWLAAYVGIKGSFGEASVESGSFFRHVMPAFPAFLLLGAALPLLLPGVGGRIAALPRSLPRRRLPRPALPVAAVFLALVPLVVFLALPPLTQPRAVALPELGLVVPVATDVSVRAEETGGEVRLEWEAMPVGSTAAHYQVLRAPTTEVYEEGRAPAVDGFRCDETRAAIECDLGMEAVGVTTERAFVDRPPSGEWSYRVALLGSWVGDPALADVLLLSAPGRVSLGGT